MEERIIMIRDATVEDAREIGGIYNYYVENTIITFDEKPYSEEVVQEWMAATVSHYPWIVWAEEDQILGYAHAGAWKSRCAFKHTVESTVYLAPEATGKGLGSLLYGELLKRLLAQGIHTAIGGIALPNEASVALHEKLVFEKVGHMKEVGFKFGKWIDVGYWQLVFTEGSEPISGTVS